MVTLKDIQKTLKELKTNKDKLSYLKEILGEIEDKELKQNVKDLIEDIKELESVAQIETKGRVEWSLLEDEEPVEERRLERQVAFIPLPEEEKKEEFKIEYGLQSNVDFYQGKKIENSGLSYEGANKVIYKEDRNSFNDDNLIERRASEQFMGKEFKNPDDEVIARMERYEHSSQKSTGYASLSEEIHDKDRKKQRH